jgi:hypothetical protein
MNTIQLRGAASAFQLHTQSLQVKMFIHNDPREAEDAIAQWLQQHDVTIHHLTQSQSEKNGKFLFVLSVFYAANS